MADVVLRGASLPGQPHLWDVAIAGQRISAVTPHARAVHLDRPGARPVELDGRLVTRPFADVHLHLDKSFQSDLVTNRSGTLDEAIELSRLLREDPLDHELLVGRIMRGAGAALSAGSTRLRTHVDVDVTVGLRGVQAALAAREMLTEQVQLEIVAFPQDGIDDAVHELLRESLVLGCDAIGGIPARGSEPREHIERVFDLAERFDRAVDMHVDESDDERDTTLELVANETIRRGWEGRVTAGHCCSLAAQPADRRAWIVERVQLAGVHIVTLPSTNLYLQGRTDDVPRRGLAPVKELLSAGVNVAYGSDNIRDVFNPFGNASMVETALLLAHAAHMGSPLELEEVFAMATVRPAALLDGVSGPVGAAVPIVAGSRADLLVFPVRTVQDVIVSQAHPSEVYVAGSPVVRRRQEVHVVPSAPRRAGAVRDRRLGAPPGNRGALAERSE